MPRHEETRILPYAPGEMFAVVADVERYPEFLPWCTALRVRARRRDEGAEIVVAEMLVGYKGLRERFTSRVRLDPSAGVIEVTDIDGPFSRLLNRWRFVPAAEGVAVHFLIDFEFRSRILAFLARNAFASVLLHMIEAFERRAHTLYGSQHPAQEFQRGLDGS